MANKREELFYEFIKTCEPPEQNLNGVIICLN